MSPDVAVRWKKSNSLPYPHGKNPMGGLKNSSWQCPPRKNSAQISGCIPPLVSPDVAVRWKKSKCPPYTRGKNPMWGLKNSTWQCPQRKNSAQILGSPHAPGDPPCRCQVEKIQLSSLHLWEKSNVGHKKKLMAMPTEEK